MRQTTDLDLIWILMFQGERLADLLGPASKGTPSIRHLGCRFADRSGEPKRDECPGRRDDGCLGMEHRSHRSQDGHLNGVTARQTALLPMALRAGSATKARTIRLIHQAYFEARYRIAVHVQDGHRHAPVP
jgi:hypothetical protein